jgi:hypothetical protein
MIQQGVIEWWMMERKTVFCYSRDRFWIYAQREPGFRAYGSEDYGGGKFVRVHVIKGRGMLEDWLHIFFNFLSIWRLVNCPTKRGL